MQLTEDQKAELCSLVDSFPQGCPEQKEEFKKHAGLIDEPEPINDLFLAFTGYIRVDLEEMNSLGYDVDNLADALENVLDGKGAPREHGFCEFDAYIVHAVLTRGNVSRRGGARVTGEHDPQKVEVVDNVLDLYEITE